MEWRIEIACTRQWIKGGGGMEGVVVIGKNGIEIHEDKRTDQSGK